MFLLAAHSIEVEVRIRRDLRDILSLPLEKEDWLIVIAGTRDLLHQVDQASLSDVLKLIVFPLRRSRYCSALTLFHNIYIQGDEEERRRIWPYVVNELVVGGGRKNSSEFPKLRDLTSSLQSTEMLQGLSVLRTLDCITEQHVASDLCTAITPRCYQLFAALLTTPILPQVAARIIDEFLVHPPEQVMEAVCPFLRNDDSLHVRFLLNYLRQGGAGIRGGQGENTGRPDTRTRIDDITQQVAQRIMGSQRHRHDGGVGR